MPRERASFASTEPPRWAASKSSPENIASASFPILPTKGPLARHMKRHVLRTQATVRLTVEPKAPSPDADEPAAPRGSVASLLKRRSSSVSSLLTRERERLKLEETMREYEAMRSRASAALHLGDWSAAEEALSEQIKLQDRSAVLFNSRSYVNLKLDRPEQSLADADMAVSLEPHSPIGHYRRAQALSRTYRTQEAGSALIKSMDYSGGDGAATDDGGFVNLPDWADVERSVAYGVPIEGRKAPTGDGPDVARFGDVLGRIRRNRRFSSLSSVSPNSSITSPGVATRLPAIGHKRTGHGLGPSRLGDDHVSQLVAPSQVPLPVASAVGMRCMTVQWQEPTSLDEEIDGYTLEYTEASLHEARKPTPEEAVDDGRASDAPVASAGTNAGAELDWRVAYHGPAHSFELVELETDSEYLVRVAAFNCAGVGEWSPQLRVTTLAIEEDRAEAEIPDKWLGLRKHLDSELGQDSAFRSREGHWDAIVAAFQKHQRSIRIAFRLNALYGEFLPREKAKGTGAAAAGVAATPSSSDEDATIASKPAPADAPDAFCLTTEGSINSIDHHQYRTFLSDCSINAAGKGGKAVSSHAATEIFEHVSASEIDDAVAAPIAKGFLGTSAEAASRVREDVRLSLHEFVHALVLLGQARYGGTSGIASDEAAPLAKGLDLLLQNDVVPNASFDVFDEMSRVVHERGIRAVLHKHSKGLRRAYKLYSAADIERDEADYAAALEGGGDSPSGKQSSLASREDEMMSQLDLPELLTMLQDARLLDNSCTARMVINFFAKVNLDDELFKALEGARTGEDGDSTQLDFAEFTEIVCRICDAKMPPPRLEAFEEVLDKWLGLLFLPAVKAKGRQHLAKKVTKPRAGSLLDLHESA